MKERHKKKAENLRLVCPAMPHLASLVNLRDSGKPHPLLHRLVPALDPVVITGCPRWTGPLSHAVHALPLRLTPLYQRQ